MTVFLSKNSAQMGLQLGYLSWDTLNKTARIPIILLGVRCKNRKAAGPITGY